jgi:eukaryotic-like serine/threonine-protein kinase
VADEIIIDEYTLLNHIATGSSTQVWEAIEKGGGDKHWALKLMLPEALKESEQRGVLKHEAKLAERFDHPNLIPAKKLVMTKKRAYIVMDYFKAPNLKMQLAADGVSLQIRVTRLFEQLCQALGYLHDQGWVHRDVKPDNILFNKASELRLIDFSLTTRAGGVVSKLMGSKGKVIQGTRTYISPETILKAPPSPQSDIYSLGITLFEVLTGEPPFRGTSPDDLLKKHLTSHAPPPSAINDNVTPEMDRFVLKMLAKKVKDRHKNTRELLAEFRNITPYKEDPGERDRRLKKELEERYKHTLDKSGRLDSRADHLMQQLLRENPEMAREQAEKKKKLAIEEAEKKKAIAARIAKKSAEEKAPAAAPAPRPAAAAPPAPAAPVRPAQPMPGYPAGYGYPGPMPPAYPVGAYPPVPGYPQMPGGYPQPGGYPHAPGYPAGAQMPPGYPPGGYPPTQYPMQPHQMPRPQQAYPPGQPSAPGYPGGVPGPQPGAAPHGNQPRPPAAQPGVAPGAGRPAPAQAGLTEQQQLLQQMLGQPAGAPGVPGRPTQAPAPQRPAQPKASPDLPLMDQLPPVK